MSEEIIRAWVEAYIFVHEIEASKEVVDLLVQVLSGMLAE